ncbi:hypothetical protein [Nocardia nova]|uniref:hypothetical protein n=1 Tax=Nocardia nova TaxID=37330 RepID=UPI0007A3B6A7|nr:hypothetical protein [Nocardia nova]
MLNLGAFGGGAALRDRECSALYARQAALLRRGQDHGQLRADLDPQLLAVTYQGMVDSMLDYLDTNPDVDPLTYADHVADVLLAGITPPGKR